MNYSQTEADFSKVDIKFFRDNLLSWYGSSYRSLPWKEESDPYLIWLSEIILQQTRVEQGLPYYLKFKKRFPKVQSLAQAHIDEVLKLWEGLGYYSRARNLHSTAIFISKELNGIFPNQYEEILALKGVGPYTAAAIASFAYRMPYPVIDGNVYRVLSRFFGIKIPIDSSEGKKAFNVLAQKALDRDNPGRYNQAIMDFGATHCKPKIPLCASCPFKGKCYALEKKVVDKLPLKSKKLKKKKRFFHYLIIQSQNEILISKREKKDIWNNLYEFPLIEADKLYFNIEQLSQNKPDIVNKIFNISSIKNVSKGYKQVLTHQEIYAVFFELRVDFFSHELFNSFQSIKRENLVNFAIPKLIHLYLEDKSLNLYLQ